MENSRDDELIFAQLKKAKRRKRRKVIITVLILLALAGTGVFTAVRVLQEKVRTQFAANTVEVKTYTAEVGRISSTVSGSGTLSYTGHEDITVPEGVEITQRLVEVGDSVGKGDVIATVDINSVLTALADAQDQLKSLDTQINSAKNDSVSSYLSSAVAGRVKKLYASAGDDVVDVMTKHGALAILSLDGLMKLEIEADLKAGEKVNVSVGEKSYAGTVESSVAGKSTITLTDDGPAFQAKATVTREDGKKLGSGRLAVHNPIAVTGYAGTVSWVNVQENQQTYAGGALFTLTNTQYTANYDTLLRQRGEMEKTVSELIALMQTGSVRAAFSGIVTAVNDPDAAASVPSAASAYLGGGSQTASPALVTIAPDEQFTISVGVDETDILSLEVGQSAQVKVSSVSDDSYPGTVTEISKMSTSASGVTQYTAVVTIDRQSQMLSGMTASVDIQIHGVDDVVLIPVDALHQTRNMYFAYTSYDEELKEYGGMVEVTTGMSNSSFVEVVSGLKPGDTVYYTEKTANGFFGMMPMGGNWGSGNYGSSRNNRSSSRTGTGG